MTSGLVTFANSTLYPLTSSMLFERPYLSICRNQQKKKKPQCSKLSILTKASIGSTKVTSNQYKKSKQHRNYKVSDKKIISSIHPSKEKRKKRSNSCKNRMDKTIKVERLGLSYQPQDFKSIPKQTPMSRTVCKKQQLNSISPLYSSLIFNSVEQNFSPEGHDELSEVLNRTFHILSQYKQKCADLRKQRDFYKKKYCKLSAKIKRTQGSCFKQK